VTLGKVPGWIVVALAATVAGVFIAERVSENKAADRVREAVRTASRARVNGEDIPDPKILLATLRLVDHIPAHHSHPTTPIRIDLVHGSSSAPIVIARDSERPMEFWTYLPGPNWHHDALGQSAGRITSSDLDAFLRKRGL